MGVAAVNTANNLLYLMTSGLLSLMALSGIFASRNLKKLDLKIIPPAEVFAKLPASFEVEIENKKIFPSFLLKVKDAVFLVVNKNSVQKIETVFQKRGKDFFEIKEIESPFPFSFFWRAIPVNKKIEVIVFPEPVPISERGSGQVKGDSNDIIGIREYQVGDPLKKVHWKLSAKEDKLLIKETSSDLIEPQIIDVDKLPGKLEQKLSEATFLIIRNYKMGIPFGLRLGKSFLKPALSLSHKIKALTMLALYKSQS